MLKIWRNDVFPKDDLLKNDKMSERFEDFVLKF